MVKKKAGEKKRELILDTCKTLFYEKGYQATTYEDICKAADVPPGSITYHLKGKKQIAALIHSEYELKVRDMMKQVTVQKYDRATIAALEIMNWWNRLEKNENLKNFLIEITEAGITLYSSFNLIKTFYKELCSDLKVEISKNRLTLITASHIGTVSELLLLLRDNKFFFKFNELADFVIENNLKAVNMEYKSIREVIKSAHTIYQELPINNDYFAYFRYDPGCIQK